VEPSLVDSHICSWIILIMSGD